MPSEVPEWIMWGLVRRRSGGGAVSVVAAGPAAAAKGGNSETAHACQQGGHEHRLDGETHKPFKNAGDCVNNGAKGEDSEYLFIDPSSYDCLPPMTGVCWGTLDANGRRPGNSGRCFSPRTGRRPTGPPRLGRAPRTTAEIGVPLNLPCGQGSTNAYAIAPEDNISDTPAPPRALTHA